MKPGVVDRGGKTREAADGGEPSQSKRSGGPSGMPAAGAVCAVRTPATQGTGVVQASPKRRHYKPSTPDRRRKARAGRERPSRKTHPLQTLNATLEMYTRIKAVTRGGDSRERHLLCCRTSLSPGNVPRAPPACPRHTAETLSISSATAKLLQKKATTPTPSVSLWRTCWRGGTLVSRKSCVLSRRSRQSDSRARERAEWDRDV